MRCRERKSKRGYVLIAIGGIMLMGLLNLGFLFPFAIASFLIYKGWKLIKPQTSSYATDMNWPVETFSQKAAGMGHDPLDEWEKKLQK